MMSATTREILLNREVIAVDQDSAGHQGHRIAQSGDLEVWAKPLADGGQAVALFNRGAATATMTVHWIELGLGGALTVRDQCGICGLIRPNPGYEMVIRPRFRVTASSLSESALRNGASQRA